MASQSQGIQQLLQAEKRAAEKVAEARKSEYGTARLRQPHRGGCGGGGARPGAVWPGPPRPPQALRPGAEGPGAAGSPQPCSGGVRSSAGPGRAALEAPREGSVQCEGWEPQRDPPARERRAQELLQDATTITWPSLGAWLCFSLSYLQLLFFPW